MLAMLREAVAAFEQRRVTGDRDGVGYEGVAVVDVLPGEGQLRRMEAMADPYASVRGSCSSPGRTSSSETRW